MVHRARRLQPARLRRRVVDVEAAAPVAARLPAGLEPERAQQPLALLGLRRVRAHAGEAADAVLGGDVGRVRRQRLVARVVDEQLERQPLRVVERQRILGTRSPPTRVAQKSSDSCEPTRNETVCTIPSPARPRGEPGYSKNVMSAPDEPLLVRVEEVVDGRVVLVDRLLHHAQPEHARVELDVRRRVAGDAGDVMDAFELHRCIA